MHARQMVQYFLLPSGVSSHAHLPAVACPRVCALQVPLLEPVHQSHRTVMADEQVLGELSHGRASSIVQGMNRQQHLVLLRFQFLSAAPPSR